MAMGKQAYSSSSLYYDYTADRAIDGDLGTFFASGSYDATPWLAIDLATPSLISQVVLYTRPYWQQNIYNAQIRISNFSITSTDSGNGGISGGLLIWTLQGSAQSLGPFIRVNLPSPVVGQWVTLQNFHPGESEGITVQSNKR